VRDWFLPEAERPRSSGNLVIPHLHGISYFARLAEVVGATKAGDRVYFTDWRGDPDELLTEQGPSIGELLCQAAHRKVDVRGLLWRSHSDKTSFSAQENQRLGTEINDAGGEALLDQRVRRGGSHHQKMVIIRHRDRPEADLAFVGGIDLCHSRRDDEDHAGDPQAQPMDKRYGPRPPWHDAMLEIRGPAVADVLETFLQRWNDPTPLDHRNPYRWLLQRAAGMPRRTKPMTDTWPPPPPAGRHQVQVLRTYASKRPRFPFAADGERSIACAYEHAFARPSGWSTSRTSTCGPTLSRALSPRHFADQRRCRSSLSYLAFQIRTAESVGHPTGLASWLRWSCSPTPAAIASRSMTWRTEPVPRSTFTPRSASSMTSG
jgi:phosphatidylserine/phosphatidylglycerophosphate/cardiolipin synthase-like enzyme